jgi:signal transduction histidine kinase
VNQNVRIDQPESCLAGGGEMGALIRAHDWAATPLGPVATWPQSLRTAISIVLESRFGMYIAWGPEFTQFYNDGYRPILGSTKHPAIGKSSRETFRESWHIIGPLFQQVMEGTAVGSEDWLLPLDRHGYLEECYFIFSYSPIRDESGGVGGVLVTVTESTERVLGERRLHTLRDLAASAAETHGPAQAWTRAMEALRLNAADLPFAALYELIDQGRTARLISASGMEAGGPSAPERVDLTGAGDVWPLAQVARSSQPVTAPVPLIDVRERPGRLSPGAWPEPPHTALVLPVTRPGLAVPYGILVAGVSAGRALDGAYREFYSMVTSHIATAISNARAYDEERRRAESLAELDRAKTAFFSNVSHEFRTPLTLMLGPLEDLIEAARDAAGDAQREQLETVHRNGHRLLKLVNSLLDFARIEAGRVQADYEPVDLAALTTDLASVFRSVIERAGLRFTVDCPPLPGPVHGDRDMWEKIVLNLLSNAFKFTFAGEIAVALAWQGDHVELAVRDTGVGIASDALPSLFQRFQRVRGSRSRTHEGSGIGLALVQELARLHGGAVAVDSEPGRGSTFRVIIRTGCAHLPAEQIRRAHESVSTAIGAHAFVAEATRWLPDTGAATGPDPDQAEGLHSRDVHARVLVVDDNADMRDYLRRILGQCWAVETAADGQAALEAARARPPDLVLTDVMMPGMDGFALIRALRQDDRSRGVPVMMLSARAGEEARIQGLQGGADDYLVKPFSARELVARVASQLSLAGARRMAEKQRAALYELFMQAPVPICVIRGHELVFEIANPRYERLVGRSQIAGKTLFEALPELFGQGYDELLRRVLATGQPEQREESLVRLVRRPRGGMEDTWWTFIYAPLRDASGRVERVMVLCTEVTAQVAARRQAERANRAKDDFLAMLGHELRNPLAPILAALHLMKLRGSNADAAERQIIERQVQHLVRLVDDLLDVARITHGKIELDRAPVEMAEVVAQAVEMSRPMFEQRRHHLEVSVPARGMRVLGDQHRLAQVVSNLLANAAKYTPQGGHVSVSATRRGQDVILRVVDDGVGMSPDLLANLFELFVQAPQNLARSDGGLGLGLAIVRNLITLHGGLVEAASEGPGRGSAFEVRLPLHQEAQPAPRSTRGAARTGTMLAAPGHRVLIVDDNVDAADLLAESLRLVGYDTRTAYDGRAALKAAESLAPDVVLLDLGLPLMDGYEVAQRLGKLPGTAGARLVAVTGYGQSSDRERSRQAGFHEHLVKPVQLDQVRSILERLLSSG